MNGVSLKCLVISDLHLEHGPIWRPLDTYPEHDVVILAGDIDAPLDSTIEWLARGVHFGDKPVILVAGNHEYYGRLYDIERSKAQDAADDTRVRFGDGEQVFVIGGVRFLAATLWTDYKLYGNQQRAMIAAQRGMNDHQVIGKIQDDGSIKKFSTANALALHEHDLAYFERNLAIPFDGPTVCVSHHGVGGEEFSVPAEFHGDPLSPSFSSDLKSLLLRHQPESPGADGIAAWIHGHTHGSVDCEIGATRVVCNPKGYGPMYGGRLPENKHFIEDLIIEIPFPAPTPRMR